MATTPGSPYDSLYLSDHPTRPRAPRKSQRAGVARRFRDLSRFVREVNANLTPTERSVWLCVFAFSQRNRTTIGQSTLAEYGGVGVRAVKKAVASLKRNGLIRVLEQGYPGRTSVYRYEFGRPGWGTGGVKSGEPGFPPLQ